MIDRFAYTAMTGAKHAMGQLANNAHNLANLQTPEFRRERVAYSTQPDGGVSASAYLAQEPGASMETDLVEQLQARNAFLANLAVFRTSSRVRGSLVDLLA